MKTMYKAYENNTQLEVVNVVKDTGKTVHYHVKKITIGYEDSDASSTLLRTERKESDWYKYCNTKQEAQAWLLMKVEARCIAALEELNLANKIKNAIVDVKL